jgi:two-component system, NarL family, sensor histidine kinase UhpB
VDGIQNVLLLCCTPLGAAAILILIFRIRGLIPLILGIGSSSFLIASGFTYLFSSQIIPYPKNEFPFNYIMFYNIMGTLLESIMFFGSFTYRSKLILERDAKEKLRLANIRTDIAKDLHDEIGATLTSINILSQVSHQIIKEEPVKAAEMINQISLQSKTVQQNMSDIVWSLRVDIEDTQSLFVRMREYAAQTLEPLNIKTNFELQQILENYKLPVNYRKEMLLIYKEAINNIAKHSGATNVQIALHKTVKNIVLSINDNGIWKGNTSGLGTKSMNDRALVLNGKIELLHENNNGTTVKLQIPIP